MQVRRSHSRFDIARCPQWPVTATDFAAPVFIIVSSIALRWNIDVHDWRSRGTLRTLFPRILKGQDIAAVVDGFVAAQHRGRAILFALGAHVIKCGLSPLLIDMMRRGWLNGLVLNGAGAIHDLEVALIGATSEDVAQHLGTGMFGMVEETPRLINAA